MSLLGPSDNGSCLKETLRLGVSSVLLATLLTACGSAAKRRHPVAEASSIAVAIEVKITGPQPSGRRFSLGCGPTSGTLPMAARVCAAIAAHPASMLHPRSSRTLCYDPERGPVVTVRTTWQGRLSVFSGQPGCGWPGTTPLGVYYNASLQH